MRSPIRTLTAPVPGAVGVLPRSDVAFGVYLALSMLCVRHGPATAPLRQRGEASIDSVPYHMGCAVDVTGPVWTRRRDEGETPASLLWRPAHGV